MVEKKFFIFLVFFCFSFSTFGEVVKHVIDGDTLLLEDGRKIRLIGVDCPELNESKKMDYFVRSKNIPKEKIIEMGREAKAFVLELVGDKEVKLKYDLINSSNDNLDKYGRLLAYVYFEGPKRVPEVLKSHPQFNNKKVWKKLRREPIFLNALIIQCGYGIPYRKFYYKYKNHFWRLCKSSQNLKAGLWGWNPGLDVFLPKERKPFTPTPLRPTAIHFFASSKSNIYHRRGCPFLRDLKHGEVWEEFTSRYDADQSGRISCPHCCPDQS